MSEFIYNITEFVNLKDKHLVNGYIRLLIEDNPLNLIPQTVIMHCLWYYFQFELYFKQHDVYALDTSYDIYRYHCDKIPESFEDMNLRENLLRGVYAYGFEKPLPIQQRSILPIIKGRDIIIQSQSGSGKSSAYLIAILQILDLNEPQCQSLIIEPTRESARQHEKMIRKLSNYFNIRSRVCIGGMSVRDDVKAFSDNNIQIVIGTLGRINSMVSRGVLKLEKLKIIVFDDMDEIFNRMYKEQIYELIEYSPLNIQIAVFSCRICQEILQFEEKLMKNTHKIYLKKQEKTLDGIKQYYVDVEKEELKLERIYELLKYMTDIDKLIIYCNTNKKVIWLTKQLEKYKFNVNGKSNIESNDIKILIKTDFNASQMVQYYLVINYDLPMIREYYINRIGRYGCYGRKGIAINFITKYDKLKLKDLEHYYNTNIDKLPIDVLSVL